MKRLSALLTLATLLAAAPAFAGVTFTTRDDATNSLGNPVSAAAEFTIVPDGILVKINNTTSNIKNYSQSLQGITFTVYGRRAQGTINFSQARTRTITPEGMQSSASTEDANWQLVTSGSTYTLRAPGRQRHVLPQTNDLVYTKGDKTLKDAPESNPFLAGPVTIHILNKDIGLTDDIIGVKFSWGDELGGFDAKLTADSSNNAINTAAGGAGGGGGGGDLGGTPGSISLAPPSFGESFELGLEGASSGPIDNGAPVNTPTYGGDPGGGGGSSNPQASNQPSAPLGPGIPQTPPLFVPPGTTGPNPVPPTAVASNTPAGSTPATRITVPTNQTDPNAPPVTADPTADTTSDTPPDIRIPLPTDQFGPNPLPPTAIADDTLTFDNPSVSTPIVSDSIPLSAPVQSVPEPAALTLLALGSVALLRRKKK